MSHAYFDTSNSLHWSVLRPSSCYDRLDFALKFEKVREDMASAAVNNQRSHGSEELYVEAQWPSVKMIISSGLKGCGAIRVLFP